MNEGNVAFGREEEGKEGRTVHIPLDDFAFFNCFDGSGL